MTTKIIGYARVSTEEQNLDLQIQALERAGCERIFSDHGISGAVQSRHGLDGALATLKAGDKLVVWRLDRLGRSLSHLVQLMEKLGRRKVRFHSVSESIDTTSSGGRLVFHMMAALAEFERSLISERTRAGMAAAKARGRRMGRAPALNMPQRDEARRLIDQEHWTIEKVAMHFGVHPCTLTRHLRSDDERRLRSEAP
jgi:DNA invertase Pin-like site-specific DNA recombinase